MWKREPGNPGDPSLRPCQQKMCCLLQNSDRFTLKGAFPNSTFKPCSAPAILLSSIVFDLSSPLAQSFLLDPTRVLGNVGEISSFCENYCSMN
jgi:hypothetical protein